MMSSRLEIGLKEFQDKDFWLLMKLLLSCFVRTEAEKAVLPEPTWGSDSKVN